jgi:hypothetical protein
MCQKVIDHSRGLCGKVANTEMSRFEFERNPPKCLCCRATMQLEELESLGMKQLGMFRAICPDCPSEPKAEQAA